MSGDSGDEVWADPAVIFDSAATIRTVQPAEPLTLAAPTTGGLWADMLLATIADGCASLPTTLAENLEAIAKVFSIGAVDAFRAGGGDD